MDGGSGSQQDPELISFQHLRQAIGFLGVALPLVLAIGKLATQGAGLEPTISQYYHTDMRNYFVGSLCAIAVFLMSYRGYDRRDLLAGRLGFLFAIGVAFFPTTPQGESLTLVGGLHLASAVSLFLTFAYMCWFLFTQTDPNKSPTPRKLKRNTVYRVCAVLILLLLVATAVVMLTPLHTTLATCVPVFWLESATVVTFGVGWLTKGERILKDEQP